MEVKEFVRINPSTKHVKGRFEVFVFEEGKFKIVYAPSLNLSAYGNTDEEAHNMFKESIHEYFKDYFMEYGVENLYADLRELGWKRNKFFKKKLSNLSETTFEDIKKEFNLPDDATYRKLEMAV